jgi:hypothetical protein
MSTPAEQWASKHLKEVTVFDNDYQKSALSFNQERTN